VRHVYQESERGCGQACVAMIAELDFDTACDLVGHRRATRTRDLVTALRAVGVECADKLERVKKDTEWPNTCILKIWWLNKNGVRKNHSHWMVYHDGLLHDPGSQWGPVSYECFSTSKPEGNATPYSNGRITSYLRIDREISST